MERFSAQEIVVTLVHASRTRIIGNTCNPLISPSDFVLSCNERVMRTGYNVDFKDGLARGSIGAWDYRPREVSLTPNKRGSFGGYGIELDEHLATVLGGREGQKIPPAEMTKRLWQYIKRHNLGKKGTE